MRFLFGEGPNPQKIKFSDLSGGFGNEITERAFAAYRELMAQREEILRAFIAKYGFEPDRLIQVEQRMNDGSRRWFVVRRSDEQMAELSRLASEL